MLLCPSRASGGPRGPSGGCVERCVDFVRRRPAGNDRAHGAGLHVQTEDAAFAADDELGPVRVTAPGIVAAGPVPAVGGGNC